MEKTEKDLEVLLDATLNGFLARTAKHPETLEKKIERRIYQIDTLIETAAEYLKDAREEDEICDVINLLMVAKDEVDLLSSDYDSLQLEKSNNMV